MSEQVTQKQVEAILEKNGIHSLDDLTKLITENDKTPGVIVKRTAPDSPLNWIISFWQLPRVLKDHKIDDLPQELGGDLLKKRNK